MRCTVVGAGVSGLTTAIRLLESGHEVEIVSEKFSPETVSDVAAAIWYPFLVKPADRADTWGIVTYDVLESLSTEAPDCLLYTSPSPRDQRGSRMPGCA